jgi:hypothetical protein
MKYARLLLDAAASLLMRLALPMRIVTHVFHFFAITLRKLCQKTIKYCGGH